MSQPKEKFLKDYKPNDFIIEDVELDFIIKDEYVDVLSILHVKAQNDTTILKLDTLDLELLEIYLNDLRIEEPRYKIEEEALYIYNVPQEFHLTIKNRIYPAKNTELEGLYVSGDILCTQCEPEGFRRITPFIDRPDNMSKFTTTITADKEKFPILLSNGNLISKEEIGNKLCVTWEDPFAKPSYLFALVAGDLGFISDSFQTRSKKEVELNIYTDKGNEKRALYAMDSLKRAMKWDEDVYDREYDLDIYNIVAVDSFNMGAMENKGLNIFNSAYVLADKEVATDKDFMGIESVIAHEYFHNWTGNRITCRDWFQLTLKEGLTVFRDQCFSADMNSPTVQRIEDVKALRERQFSEDASPMRHPIQPKSYISMNNFYTSTVYEKGAEVIRMIHTLLGKKKFKKGMDIYFETFDGKAVTTDDFIWAMEQGGEVDLTQFKRWYDQSGTPVVEIKENFENNQYSLTITQHIPKDIDGNEQKELYFPFDIALFEPDTKQELLTKQLIIKEKEEKFILGNFEQKPILSPNRDFSAPVIIEYKEQNYPFLAKYDTNGFNQYEALSKYAIETIHNIVQKGEVDPGFIATYDTALKSETELLFKSLLLELPSIMEIISNLDEIAIQEYIDAMNKLKKTLSQEFKNELLELYHSHHQPNNSELDPLSKGKRAIKNYALRLLGALQDQEIFLLAQEQFQTSRNMGDKLTALSVLNDIDHAKAKPYLQAFYDRYSDNPLLMVKYFAIEASLADDFVLSRIIELEKDKAFDQKVPNLVRALYGAFSRNLQQFHKEDGSGYAFLAQKIIEIDKINPQMAASLANSFKLYQKITQKNKELMKKELEKILTCKDISANCYEIVSKTLAKE
ncbi:MAG: aminopeptidase N [Epsilonproteobacteria bacterium]|nr:aminopeptidase N [Campylobacterota bacterium]